MAWTTAKPGASQNGDNIPIPYSTYRNMKGRVEFRFTDIAINNGAQWYLAVGHINLIDNTGHTWADKSVGKDWGVVSPFTYLCFIPGNRLVRMEVSMRVINSAGKGYYNTWKSELRWNNSTAV